MPNTCCVSWASAVAADLAESWLRFRALPVQAFFRACRLLAIWYYHFYFPSSVTSSRYKHTFVMPSLAVLISSSLGTNTLVILLHSFISCLAKASATIFSAVTPISAGYNLGSTIPSSILFGTSRLECLGRQRVAPGSHCAYFSSTIV